MSPTEPDRSPLMITSHDATIAAEVCRLEGTADQSTGALLDEALTKAVAQAPAMLVVDVTALTRCDFACVNSLVRAHHEAQAAGVWFVLSGAGPQLLRLLEITGTDDVVTLHTHVRTHDG